MEINIFEAYKHWSYCQQEIEAEQLINQQVRKTIKSLPESYFSSILLLTPLGQLLYHLPQIIGTRLYRMIQHMPKGVMHHNHIQCNQDREFYRRHIMQDPLIYLNSELKQFKIGTKQQAAEQGWVSLRQLACIPKLKDKSEDQLVDLVANLTIMNQQQILESSGARGWDLFEQKISKFSPLVWCDHIFSKYVRWVFLKYARNGYQRVQFRALVTNLTQYDAEGNIVKVHELSRYKQIIDQAEQETSKSYPGFSIGIIYQLLKVFSKQHNKQLLRDSLALNWDKSIGVDFVNQEDLFGSLAEYDQIVDEVFAENPHRSIAKIYHAGESNHPNNRNVEIAMKAGCKRIGHGLTLANHKHLLKETKGICLEMNPVSNIVLGFCEDPRQLVCTELLQLGVHLTINPDDPGKFGYEDSTVDFFLALTCFDWSLRHLKLTFLYSIQHAVAESAVKQRIWQQFNGKWKKWISGIKCSESQQMTTKSAINEL